MRLPRRPDRAVSNVATKTPAQTGQMMRGSIQHRPDRPAPWRARYWYVDGRQRSKSFGRKVDAERWLRSELAKVDRGEWVDPELGSVPWADYSAKVLTGRVHLAARTIETDRVCHGRASPWIGDVPLSRLTPELLRQLMAELTAAGYAAETVSKTMRWVRLTLNQAVTDRRILSSPASGIRLPKPRRSDMRLLDPFEVALLADALPDRYRSLPLVAAYSGLRWGELAGLKVAHIDMLRRRLTVRSALIEATGDVPRLGAPKSAASERTISLPKTVIETFALQLQKYPPVDGVVWTTERGAFLRRGSFGRIWRKAVSSSVGQPCRVHDLRHTHASWLIAAGEHPKAIQTRLGHSSIQVTMDRYGHLMDGLDDRTADRLDAIAEFSRGPGVAQGAKEADANQPESPLARGVDWQSRPDSNWRYRLERPASWTTRRRDRVPGPSYLALARGEGLEPSITGPEPVVLPITPPPNAHHPETARGRRERIIGAPHSVKLP